MAGLRKMLGNINDTTLVSLMNMIETQSASTLAKWALDYVEEHVLMLCHHIFALIQIIRLHYTQLQQLHKK